MNGLDRIQTYLVQEGYEGIFITSTTNLHYFAGFTGTAGVAFVTPQSAYFFTDSRYTEQAQGQCSGYQVVQYKKPLWEEIKDYVCYRRRFNDGRPIWFSGGYFW